LPLLSITTIDLQVGQRNLPDLVALSLCLQIGHINMAGNVGF